MDRRVPEPLRYRDGQYTFERFPSIGAGGSLKSRRIFARSLRAIHRPWFAIRMPDGVAELTTIGRKTGRPRRTFIRAYQDGDKAYLVAIGGEHALWMKNLRANPEIALRFRGDTMRGQARDPRDDAERAAIEQAFCGATHPFDYVENLFHRSGWPSRTKILELHQAWLEGGTPLVVDRRD